MHTAIQVMGLFVGIAYTIEVVDRMITKNDVYTHSLVFVAAGWTAFIWATWLS